MDWMFFMMCACAIALIVIPPIFLVFRWVIRSLPKGDTPDPLEAEAMSRLFSEETGMSPREYAKMQDEFYRERDQDRD